MQYGDCIMIIFATVDSYHLQMFMKDTQTHACAHADIFRTSMFLGSICTPLGSLISGYSYVLQLFSILSVLGCVSNVRISIMPCQEGFLEIL